MSIKDLLLANDNEGLKTALENGANITAESLNFAVRKNNLTAVELLLDYGGNLIDKKEKDEMLEIASSLNFTEIIKILLKNGADASTNNNTPLEYAVKNKNLEIVKLLIENGVDPNIDNGFFLQYAIINKSLETLELLLQNGGDPNINNGRLLEITVQRGFIEMLKLLVKYGGDVDTRDSLLFEAVRNERIDILKFLLDSGLDVHAENDRAITITKKIPVIKTLLEYGADIHANNDELLQSCIFFAEIDLIKFLLENGANIHVNNDELIRKMSESLSDETEFIKYLISKGANFRVQNDIVLFNAVQRNRVDLVKFLVERGANIHSRDGEILEDAEMYGSEELKNYLFGERSRVIQRAREQEEKNEERRKAAIEEYKQQETKEQSSSICSNSQNLFGEDIDENEVVVFLIKGVDKGDCLTKDEISGIFSSSRDVFLWDGPPLGPSRPPGVGAGKPTDIKVYKLPWSGIWVLGNVLEDALNKDKKTILLEGEKASIGSDFGISNLHGQWGGKWGYEYVEKLDTAPNGTIERVIFQRVVVVPTEDFQPDERYLIYHEIDI